MQYFWLCMFLALLLYRLCFPDFKGYDGVILSSFLSFVLAVMGTADFLQCAVFLFSMVAASVFAIVRKTLAYGKDCKDEYCILLCEAGEGIYVILRGTRTAIGITYADKVYRRGDVVKICNWYDDKMVSVEFV